MNEFRLPILQLLNYTMTKLGHAPLSLGKMFLRPNRNAYKFVEYYFVLK
jgi:hypothetical protein